MMKNDYFKTGFMTHIALAIAVVLGAQATGAQANDCVLQLWDGPIEGAAVSGNSGVAMSALSEAEAAIGSICGIGVPANEAEGVKRLVPIAEQGFGKAQYALGMAYLQGKGVPLNVIEAQRWFRSAGYQGMPRGVAASVAIEKYGNKVSPAQWAAFQAVGLDAGKGSAAAQLQLAQWLDWNIGDSQRKREAMRWYRAAATQGNIAAQRGLGELLLPTDVNEGARWLDSAANGGDMQAQAALGMLYQRGVDGKPDHSLAYKWFRLAASNGGKNARTRLGDMFKRGDGVSVNLVLTYALYFLVPDQPLELEANLAKYHPMIEDDLSAADVERGKALIRDMAKPGGFLATLDRANTS